VWEGIGTGWFYSTLGGGYGLRPYGNAANKAGVTNLPADYFTTHRIDVEVDNTPATQRGDFTVPTLFNGNFDAITNKFDGQSIPSWSGLNQGNLETWTQLLPEGSPDLNVYAATAGNNYALRLNSGQSVTHNDFVVPDWGNLRFEVFAPTPQGGKLTPWIKGTDDTVWHQLTIPWGYRQDDYTTNIPTQQLQGVELTAGNYDYQFAYDSNYQYKYKLIQDPNSSKSNLLGYATKGFETFSFGGDALEQLRGKSASLKFTLEGSTDVYLDNVFFKSEQLNLGNPTESRHNEASPNPTNYLIERPQYSLSYNSQTKTPNWVSWQLNSTWHKSSTNGGLNRPSLPEKPSEIGEPQYNVYKNRYPFEVDYALPIGRSAVTDYFQSGYERGHLTASNDLNRDRKDQFATFLMSNMIPMSPSTNQNGAWRGLEDYSANLVEKYNKNLYIIAGGYGSLGTTNTGVNIPARLWKVIVAMEPYQTLLDINQNTDIIAVDLPNDGSAGGLSGWKQGAYLTNINTLESSIRQATNNSNFKLLSNVSDEVINYFGIKNKIFDITKYPLISSNLLAEQADTLSSPTHIISPNLNTSIGEFHSSTEKGIINLSKVTDDGVFHLDINKFGSNDIRITQNSSVQTGTSQIAIAQVGITQISHRQISSSEISSPQLNISQIASAQIYPTQISSTSSTTTESGSQKISMGQVNATEIDLLLWQTNINRLPLSTSVKLQSLFKPLLWQTNIDKLPLSSSITLQQLFNSNVGSVKPLPVVPVSSQVENLIHSSDFTYSPLVFDGIDGHPIHNTTSNLLTNIYSTAQTLWHTTTPINLNFEITNLPTGQLAEGTITSYNTNGTPKTATITIDNDANGVGWFLDTTPQDNSEFTGLDNYLQATPNSPASGKYDLLTAILHEMGHTLGIINGYNEFDKHTKNGIFTTPTTWNTLGATNIINGTATLTELSQKLSELTQAFIIPTGAKTLQFTIRDNHLVTGDTTKTANDLKSHYSTPTPST
jgi:DNA/RNA endonuclease G (NUC1)